MNLLVVFSHGKESGPWGSKIRALAEVAQVHGSKVMSMDYQQARHSGDTLPKQCDLDAPGEAERRVAQLLATPLPPHDRLILVGASMGGYVATVASSTLKPVGLFLLAPAFFKEGYANQNPIPVARRTMIVHGWCDDVVPPQNSICFAQQHCCTLHVLDGDHRLNEALDEIRQLFTGFLMSVLNDRAQLNNP